MLFSRECFVKLLLCSSIFMVTFVLFSGVDMFPADPASRGSPHVSRELPNLQKTKICYRLSGSELHYLERRKFSDTIV